MKYKNYGSEKDLLNLIRDLQEKVEELKKDINYRNGVHSKMMENQNNLVKFLESKDLLNEYLMKERIKNS